MNRNDVTIKKILENEIMNKEEFELWKLYMVDLECHLEEAVNRQLQMVRTRE